jgi:hypothetical protein
MHTPPTLSMLVVHSNTEMFDVLCIFYLYLFLILLIRSTSPPPTHILLGVLQLTLGLRFHTPYVSETLKLFAQIQQIPNELFVWLLCYMNIPCLLMEMSNFCLRCCHYYYLFMYPSSRTPSAMQRTIVCHGATVSPSSPSHFYRWLFIRFLIFFM